MLGLITAKIRKKYPGNLLPPAKRNLPYELVQQHNLRLGDNIREWGGGDYGVDVEDCCLVDNS